MTSSLLMLPAPARFKLNKSIKVPRVQFWARELDFRRRWPYYTGGPKERQAHIAEAEVQLDVAEWIAAYIAEHDCNPRILERRDDKNWGTRSALVQVEDSIYRVTVRIGRRALGMYGKRGHHWHITVMRNGADRRLLDGARCEKSAGLGSEAVRQHLMWKLRTARGTKPLHAHFRGGL